MPRDLRRVIQSFLCYEDAEIADVREVKNEPKRSRVSKIGIGGSKTRIGDSTRKVTKKVIDIRAVGPKGSTPRNAKKELDAEAKDNSNYSALLDLQPMISDNITLLFVGFNPGVESSRQQHHYAHPTNLFWKLFNALDVLKKVLTLRKLDIDGDEFLCNIFVEGKLTATAQNDDQLVPYGVGFTDLVLRCTKTAQELTKQEKLNNVPRLFSEFARSNAKWVVVIGKGIWEFIVKYINPSHRLTKENFLWGLQTGSLVNEIHRQCDSDFNLYVFPNTSGLVALMKYPEKLALWEQFAASII